MELTDEFLSSLVGARKLAIYKMRQAGQTFVAISKAFGISTTTTAQLYRSAKVQIEEKNWHWHAGLSNRIVNALCNFKLKSREDLMALYKSGKLQPHGQIRNYGWKCHREVAAWLGLPEPEKTSPKAPKPQFCPHCHCRI